MLKIDPKMLKAGKVIGSAVLAGLAAFSTDIEKAQLKKTVVDQGQLISDLLKRVTELEKK